MQVHTLPNASEARVLPINKQTASGSPPHSSPYPYPTYSPACAFWASPPLTTERHHEFFMVFRNTIRSDIYPWCSQRLVSKKIYDVPETNTTTAVAQDKYDVYYGSLLCPIPPKMLLLVGFSAVAESSRVRVAVVVHHQLRRHFACTKQTIADAHKTPLSLIFKRKATRDTFKCSSMYTCDPDWVI